MWQRITLAAIFCIAFLFGFSSPVPAAQRTALVIGNGAYESAPLKNPANDAVDMAKALRELGFKVIEKINANKRDMILAVDEFASRLRDAEIGVFYFAGHGMQIHGRNYLIPVKAHVTSETDVQFEAMDAGRVLGKMQEAGNKLNIVILDACRDNPFKRSFRTETVGLAQMDAPKGSIIAYATAPGSVSADGQGRNGLYTKHLLKSLPASGLTVQDVFMETGMGVMKETGDKQIPWISSTPVPRYYLASRGTSSGTVKADKIALPSEGGASFDDILKTKADRQQAIERWSAWQSARDKEYAQVQEIDSDTYLKPEEKKTAWELFLSAVSDNNPFSEKDEELRGKAEERARYWKGYKVASVPSTGKKPVSSPSGSNEIDRDGVYVAYANGTVRDTSTGLEWKVGPDRDTNWNEARSWVRSLGDDWRMPTMDELEHLYQKGKGDRNMTPLLKTTGWFVWSGEEKGSSGAWFFGFNGGYRYWHDGLSNNLRAFAVRSRSDG
jgi:hypothetical protein